MKSNGTICGTATTVPQKSRVFKGILAQKAEQHESRNEGGGEDGVPLTPLSVLGVEGVLQVVLKRRGCAGREVP